MPQERSPAPTCAPWLSSAPGPVFTRASIRELDRLALVEFGIPSILLIENAAIRIAEFAAGVMPDGCGVLVSCGPGNNGGDGLAAARHLANAGYQVSTVLAVARDRVQGDAAVNLRIAEAMGLKVFEGVDQATASLGAAGPALVIDALLGTGLDRPVREPLRELIETVNGLGRAGVRVLSVDLPSGMNADTGLSAGGQDGATVRATWTVTLVGAKAGFAAPGAAEYLGEVWVADIGVPRPLVERLRMR